MKIFRGLLALLLATTAAAQTVRLSIEAPVAGAPAFTAPVPSAFSATALVVPSLPLSVSVPVLPAPAIPAAPIAPAVAPAKALAPVSSAPAALRAAKTLGAPSAPDKAAESRKADADGTFDGSSAKNPAADPVAGSESALGAARLQAPARSVSSSEDLVRTHSRRALRGVFIQQEQEGSLLHSDSRDSSGDVFRWYRPVEMRSDLAAETEAAMTWPQKFFYRLRRFFAFSGRDGPYAPWNAWSAGSRLLYLEKLEAALGGPAAAMNGKETLILERAPGAPEYLTFHPHLEPVHPHMAAAAGTAGARFLWPELVTAKDSPAASVSEALARTRHIIAETGHAGTQYHVFMKLEPARLEAQLEDLGGAVQAFNDVMFARAAGESLQNVAIRALSPWHAGRSARFARLVAEASAGPKISVGDDADSEKHAFVGLRWWGLEDGKAVVSMEFRGVNLPWKSRVSSMAKGVEGDISAPERDYSDAERWLTLLSLYAESLAEGRAPRAGLKTLTLSAADVDAKFEAWAAKQGQPKGSFIPYSELAKRMSGLGAVPGGYLLPFAADDLAASPALQQLANEALRQAQKAKARDDAPGRYEVNERHDQYLFWDAYKAWAAGFERRRSRDLDALFGR